MQRPLCPHPQKAWYKGGEDPNIAENVSRAVVAGSGQPEGDGVRRLEAWVKEVVSELAPAALLSNGGYSLSDQELTID